MQPLSHHHHQKPPLPAAETGPPGEEQPHSEEDSPQGSDAGHQASAELHAIQPGPPLHQGRYDREEGSRHWLRMSCTLLGWFGAMLGGWGMGPKREARERGGPDTAGFSLGS